MADYSPSYTEESHNDANSSRDSTNATAEDSDSVLEHSANDRHSNRGWLRQFIFLFVFVAGHDFIYWTALEIVRSSVPFFFRKQSVVVNHQTNPGLFLD